MTSLNFALRLQNPLLIVVSDIVPCSCITMSNSKMRALQGLTFDASVPRAARLKAIAPILVNAVDDFYMGTLKLGVEAFEVEIIRVIEDAGLLEQKRTLQCS